MNARATHNAIVHLVSAYGEALAEIEQERALERAQASAALAAKDARVAELEKAVNVMRAALLEKKDANA